MLLLSYYMCSFVGKFQLTSTVHALLPSSLRFLIAMFSALKILLLCNQSALKHTSFSLVILHTFTQRSSKHKENAMILLQITHSVSTFGRFLTLRQIYVRNQKYFHVQTFRPLECRVPVQRSPKTQPRIRFPEAERKVQEPRKAGEHKFTSMVYSLTTLQ